MALASYGSARIAMAAVDRLEERTRGTQPEARCPCCGRFTKVFTLIDLRGWPETARAALAGGNDFACDGCWTGWVRNGFDCGDGRVFSEALIVEFAAFS